MSIENLTIREARELANLFNASKEDSLNSYGLGKKVIIRTYSAGVWFGELIQKSGNEVILKNARRMWSWFAAESISLSGVANYGIKDSKSKIAPPVESIWLEAIEIIPTSDKATKSIEDSAHAKAE